MILAGGYKDALSGALKNYKRGRKPKTNSAPKKKKREALARSMAGY